MASSLRVTLRKVGEGVVLEDLCRMEPESWSALHGATAKHHNASTPTTPAHPLGSLSIAPAIIARELPGWPMVALRSARGSNVQAHLVGEAGGCELTIIHSEDDPAEKTTVAIDAWLPVILEQEVTDICIDDRGMFHAKPSLASAVEDLIHHSVRVVVVTDDAEDEFAIVARLSHLRPQLLLQHTMSPEEVWQIVAEQTGDALAPHQMLIQTICSCHPILVHLFLTALCHVRDNEPGSPTAVTDSLADAITHVVRTQSPEPHEQATFLLHLALNSDPLATAQADQSLGNMPLATHSIRQVAAALATEQVPPDLLVALWERLRSRLDPESFDLARRTLRPLLDDGLAADVHHLGLLELFTGDTDLCLAPGAAEVVRQVADAAAGPGRRAVLRALPQLLEDKSVADVTARLALLCADVDVQALGTALQMLSDADAAPDRTYEVLSPLVVLEHPALAASLAEKALAALDPDDPRLARAVLAWIMASPATACAEPGRRQRALRHIVSLAHSDSASAPVIRAGLASLRAFTRRSACRQLRELTTGQSLSSGGLPVLACCLAGLATSLNDMAEQATVWCWRARALDRTHNSEHIWVLITHALVAYWDHDGELAQELLTQAEQFSTELRAVTVSRCCRLAIQHLRAESAGSVAVPTLDNGAHAVLRAFAMHCAAILDHQNGSTQTAIEKHFTTGQTLESSSLTNPRILDWQQQLEKIFLSRNDKAIAECLHNDISAAEETWRTLNDLPAQPAVAQATATRPKLSKSEWRVAEQIAAGCTNAQAAEALFLSKRTIDTHLRNIYRRLGITGREELIDFFKKTQIPTSPAS